MRHKTDVSVSSMSKKKTTAFQPDDALGKLINLMFEHLYSIINKMEHL